MPAASGADLKRVIEALERLVQDNSRVAASLHELKLDEAHRHEMLQVLLEVVRAHSDDGRAELVLAMRQELERLNPYQFLQVIINEVRQMLAAQAGAPPVSLPPIPVQKTTPAEAITTAVLKQAATSMTKGGLHWLGILLMAVLTYLGGVITVLVQHAR